MLINVNRCQWMLVGVSTIISATINASVRVSAQVSISVGVCGQCVSGQ